MLASLARILKSIYATQILMGQNVTVGEVSRATKIPYSTVKRRLEMAEKNKLICSDVLPYKTTGKRVFWLSEDGVNWVACWQEMAL